MKHVHVVACIINGALFAICCFFIWSRGYQPGSGFTGYEVTTVVLAALAVILTALGIFIALLAIWGYQSLLEIARDRAEKIAADVSSARSEEVATRVATDVARRLRPSSSATDYGQAANEDEDANPAQ